MRGFFREDAIFANVQKYFSRGNNFRECRCSTNHYIYKYFSRGTNFREADVSRNSRKSIPREKNHVYSNEKC